MLVVFRPSYSGQGRTDFEENQKITNPNCRHFLFGPSLVPCFGRILLKSLKIKLSYIFRD